MDQKDTAKNNFNTVFLSISHTLIRIAWAVLYFAIFSLAGVFYFQVLQPQQDRLQAKALQKKRALKILIEEEKNRPIQNGVHLKTGFIADDGLHTVIATCTACHSAKIVTQNRASKEGWTDMIRWMQKTQNLWDLGDKEEIIVRYLSKNYGPLKTGRRQNLNQIVWYELKVEN